MQKFLLSDGLNAGESLSRDNERLQLCYRPREWLLNIEKDSFDSNFDLAVYLSFRAAGLSVFIAALLLMNIEAIASLRRVLFWISSLSTYLDASSSFHRLFGTHEFI